MPAGCRPLMMLLAAGVLSACGAPTEPDEDVVPEGSPTQGAVTPLSVAVFAGGGAHVAALAAEIDAFDEVHPAIEVTKTLDNFYGRPVPHDKLQQRYFEEGADVMTGFVGGSLRPAAEAGRFMDLTQLWNELGLEDAVPPSVAALSSVDGRRYWVPMMAQWNPIFYNAAVFTEAGVSVPGTWDELLAACATLRQAGVERPIAQAGDGWTPPAARWFSTLDLAINGPDFHLGLASGMVAWTDVRVRRVFDAWSQLFESGCYGEPAMAAYGDQIAELSDGRAAMENLGEWIFENPLLDDEDPIDFFTLPPIEAGLPGSQIVLVYGVAVNADTPHPEAALELVRALVSADALLARYETVPRLILDRRVDPGYLPRHVKGRGLFEQADWLVELWEFSAPQEQGEIGLDLFTSFLDDPGGLDAYLADAEAQRSAAYGPAADG